MQLQDLFEANLGTIERVISIVCWRARLFGPDAEDFASEAKLALIENDYAVLAKYEGRSSLDTFLTVVIQRLLADSRTKAKGRWHASTEASRLGPAAVLVETLILRDGRSLDEAMPHIQATHPELTRESGSRFSIVFRSEMHVRARSISKPSRMSSSRKTRPMHARSRSIASGSRTQPETQCANCSKNLRSTTACFFASALRPT